MPVQATIPSKALNYHRWKNKDILWQNQISQYLSTNSALQKIIGEKCQQKEGKYTLKKRESNLSTNPEEDSHTIIIPPVTTKITGSNNHFSIKSLNINGFHSYIKIHRLTDRVHKQDPTFCCTQETHLRVFQANNPKKIAGIMILILNRIYI